MPQLDGSDRHRDRDRDRDDLGANDELIAFKDEGEQEEKRNRAAERDLDDVKSSLVNESESNSSSESEADRRPRTSPVLESRLRHSQLFEEALRRRQDGGLLPPSPYMGYPVFMIPDLGNLRSPYLTNGALTPSTSTYLPFQWPLLDVPGRAAVRDSATPTHLSNSVPVVQHPHMSHLHPLLSYSPEAFSPQGASPSFSPDTGVLTAPHAACYPVSPGGVAQLTHPLGWLQGQPMYPLAGGFSPAALAMNASMTRMVSGSFSPRLVPTPQPSAPHLPLGPPGAPQEVGGASSQAGKPLPDARQQQQQHQEEEEERKPHIKKPLNAFMLYMREERPKVVAQCRVKESATINQILGQRWHSLTKEEQAKYYELARNERLLHSKLYPGWSARDNYGKKKKRKRVKSESHEVLDRTPPPQLKRPRSSSEDAQPHAAVPQAAHTHARSHLTHTQLSQASPASSLDSPATPTAALASPAAPAPSHTEQAAAAAASSEQLQPLCLATRPPRTPHPPAAPAPPPPPPLAFLAPPPTSSPQSGALTHKNQSAARSFLCANQDRK